MHATGRVSGSSCATDPAEACNLKPDALACGLSGGTPPQERESGLELLRPEDERHPDVDGQRGTAYRDEDQEALREIRAHPDERRSCPGRDVHEYPGHEELGHR